MKKSQLYTLGGALLASTALASVASAGTVGRVANNIGHSNANNTGGALLVTTTATIANTIFSTTTSTANAVNFDGANATGPISVSFTNNLPAATRFNATVNITGANFNNPAVDIAILARGSAGTATFVGTVGGVCGSVTPLVDKILLSSCLISGAASAALGNTTAVGALSGGLQLSGIIFNNASGLATVGSTIALSGMVNDNGNPAIVLENIDSGTVVTSGASINTTVTAGGSGVTNASTTPTAFTNFSSGGNATNLTLTLATVNITGTGAQGTTLSTVVSPDGSTAQAAALTVSITVTSAALADDALTRVATAGSFAQNFTPAGVSSNAVTFSSTGATFNGVQTISATFDGTHAINAASAGTVAVAYGPNTAGGYVQTPAAGSGATSAIIAGGFSAEFNTALASGGDFQSFIRMHNNGNSAGAVTITVLNEADGTTLGTMTTSSLAVGQTIQLSAADIETGAGITPTAGTTYTIQLAGPIIGYAQHVLFNATTGQFSDLSSFRNGGSNTNVP